VIASHGSPSALLQNCSGKHAGMLVTCVVNGWPTAGYLDPDHPLQRAVTRTIERLCGEPVAHVGVDGCGAPVHAISLVGLARAFRTIATEPPGTPAHAVAEAIRRHPFLLGGTGRDVTLLLETTPGLIAKDGAEGVYAAAAADGRAVALKIEDGGSRARACVLLEALTGLGVDVEAARAVTEVAVLGHGRPVGVVRARPLN
jgi:L-asparaginase II